MGGIQSFVLLLATRVLKISGAKYSAAIIHEWLEIRERAAKVGTIAARDPGFRPQPGP